MVDDTNEVDTAITYFIKNMKLVVNIHEHVLFNVEKAQKKQK
jgi:hypothetical protein